MARDLTFDLYVWKTPRDVDADRAETLLRGWHAAGADPRESPFEANSDVGWYHRELTAELPTLDITSDAVPSASTRPVWLSTTDEPPARIVAIRLAPAMSREALGSIAGLAAKYDLVLFDARSGRVHLPLEEMAAHASATFWPAGAIQAAVAGGIGGIIAVAAWLLGIPLVSGLLTIAGGFMLVMALYTFVHEGRKALKARRTGRGS